MERSGPTGEEGREGRRDVADERVGGDAAAEGDVNELCSGARSALVEVSTVNMNYSWYLQCHS